MSRKNTIILIILIIGLALGILFGFYYYLYSGTSGSTDASTPKSSGFFGLFGSNGTDNNQGSTNSFTDGTGTTTTISINSSSTIPRLRHITTTPIAGDDLIVENIYATSSTDVSTTTKKVTPKVIGTQEMVRWIDRGNGNIFDTATSSLDINRISNTTISKVYEGLITNSGGSVLLRGLYGDTNVIQTQYGVLQTQSATATQQMLKLNDLPANITSLSLSPTKDQIFYILSSGIRGTVSKTDGSSGISVFDSPFTEWLTSWPNASGIILTTKPSGLANGFAYLLNPKTKSVSKIVGDMVGLTTLASPDLKWMLIGSTPQSTLQLDLMNMKDKSTSNLSFKTLPEKCVWSKVNSGILYCAVPQSLSYAIYPDAWYQGVISFSDNLWKLDLNTGRSTLVLRPDVYTTTPLDMTNLTLSSKDDYITFIDKNDMSLWGYNINAQPIKKAPVLRSTATTTTN